LQPLRLQQSRQKRIVMAKALTVPNERSEPKGPQQPSQLVGTWDRWMGFLKDVRNEMRKVWTPSLKEVQSTTVVVIITVFAFAAYFYVVDQVLGRVVQSLLHMLGSSGT
jgi:preprotein translocase subunit SecE